MNDAATKLVATGSKGEGSKAQVQLAVVMPVYNAMPFLTDALDALLAQDIGLENFELIAIDDGSTDDGLATLISYAEQFPHARIYTQPNSGGPSQPRNFAMAKVEAKYFFLHDADDWLAPESLRNMVNVAEKNQTDIVTIRMVGVGGRNVPTKAFRQTLELTDIWSSELYRLQNPMKMFRTSFVREHDLHFPENMVVGEDRYFIMHAYFATHRQSLLADQDYLYFRYRDDDQNLTSRVNSFSHKFLAVKTAVELLESLAPEGATIDEFMLRHLRVEVGDAFLGPFVAEKDEALKREGFEWLSEVSRRYEHLIGDRSLRPASRAMLYFARYKTFEEATAFAADFLELVEDGHAYHIDADGTCFFVGPRFRSDIDALPDYLYVTSPRYFFNPNVTDINKNRLRIHAQTMLSEEWFNTKPRIRVFVVGENIPKDGIDIGHEARILKQEARDPRSTNVEIEVVLNKRISGVPKGRYSVKIALGDLITHLPLYGNIVADEDGVIDEVHSESSLYKLRKSSKGYLRIQVLEQQDFFHKLARFLRHTVSHR